MIFLFIIHFLIGIYFYRNYSYCEKRRDITVCRLCKYNQRVINKLKKKSIPILWIKIYTEITLKDIVCNRMYLQCNNKMPDMKYCYIQNLNCDNINMGNFDYKKLPKCMENLSIQGNKFNYIQIKNENLVSLFLANNGIFEVDFVLPNLRKLVLRNNGLRMLQLNLPKLRHIDVSRNRLINLELNAPKLETMDVSENELETIGNYKRVYELNLEYNNIVVLPEYLMKVGNLYLKGNPIIPNLNSYNWRLYLEDNYLEFFQNNVDMRVDNLYEDPEFVHNPHITQSIKECIMEIEELHNLGYKMEKKLSRELFGDLLEADFRFLGFDRFNFRDMMATIYYLGEKRGVMEGLEEVINMELMDGEKYCLMGKIGRVVTAIMGFGLIKSVVKVSQNEEIMIKYELVRNRLLKTMKEGDENFVKMVKIELRQELERIGVDSVKIEEWTQ